MASFEEFIGMYVYDLVGRCNDHLRSGERKYDFKTLGYDFQDFIERDMTSFINDNGLDVKLISTAERKNKFPDVVVQSSRWGDRPYAVDLKCANVFKMEKGAWKPNRIPNNDLGAMDGIQDKIKEFADTYYMFVQYAHQGGTEFSIQDVTARPFYHFVGKSKDGLISYREKDGMMRPTSFDAFKKDSWIRDRDHFNELLTKTIHKRQVAILEKMMDRLPLTVSVNAMKSFCTKHNMKII